MNFIHVTEPSFLPVTLAEIWDHFKMTPYGSPLATDEDDALERQANTAVTMVENFVRRSLIVRTMRLFTDSFPESGKGIKLYRPPVISIESIAYYDSDNVLTTLDSDVYYLSESLVPEVRFVASFTATVYDRPDAVQITYKAGYRGTGSPESSTQGEAAANVPKVFIDAVLYQMEALHANTSPSDREALNSAIKAMLSPHQVLFEF